MIHPILSEKAFTARLAKNAKRRAARKEAVRQKRFDETRNRVRFISCLPCESCGGLPCLEGCPR